MGRKVRCMELGVSLGGEPCTPLASAQINGCHSEKLHETMGFTVPKKRFPYDFPTSLWCHQIWSFSADFSRQFLDQNVDPSAPSRLVQACWTAPDPMCRMLSQVGVQVAHPWRPDEDQNSRRPQLAEEINCCHCVFLNKTHYVWSILFPTSWGGLITAVRGLRKPGKVPSRQKVKLEVTGTSLNPWPIVQKISRRLYWVQWMVFPH